MLSYGYVHLFWLFRIAFGFRYQLATATEHGWATRPLSPDEVATSGVDRELTVGWWWRWGLLVGLGVARPDDRRGRQHVLTAVAGISPQPPRGPRA